jgi:predicted P-loop ATPase
MLDPSSSPSASAFFTKVSLMRSGLAEFGARWMISAVARIMQPGVKADHMLILENPQGRRKSSAIKRLAGADWFTDELAEIGGEDAARQVRGIWIIEIAKLYAVSRARCRASKRS